MEKLYHYILDGLKNSPEFYNPEIYATFEEYLTSLKDDVKNLRLSYKKNKVKIDYSILGTQAAYLIAYYPLHVEITCNNLNLISSQLNFERELKACFFGAGSCPEIVGIAQFLTEKFPATKNLIANIYDIADEKWKLTRKITESYIVPQLWKGKIDLYSSQLDIAGENSFLDIESVIKSCQLCIFQNCFNEISNVPKFIENFNFLLANLPANSFIVISDLSQYQINASIIKIIKTNINKRTNFEIIQDQNIQLVRSIDIPPIITKHLLTSEDGLIPRFNIKYQLLAFRKNSFIINDGDAEV